MWYDDRHRLARRRLWEAVYSLETLAALLLILMVCMPQVAALEGGSDSRHPPFDAITAPPAGWHRRDPVQVVTGRELFAVIDGGAALYLDAGFRTAAFALYEHPNGTTVQLEIYHMTSHAAAKTVQDRKAGSAGVNVGIGDDSAFKELYLNFVTGLFQVTVYGYDPGQDTVQGIMAISRIIANRLLAQ